MDVPSRTSPLPEPSARTEAYLSGGRSSADSVTSIYATTSQRRRKVVKMEDYAIS